MFKADRGGRPLGCSPPVFAAPSGNESSLEALPAASVGLLGEDCRWLEQGAWEAGTASSSGRDEAAVGLKLTLLCLTGWHIGPGQKFV